MKPEYKQQMLDQVLQNKREEKSRALIDALWSYDTNAYSGRGMNGRKCVSITLSSEVEMWNVAQDLGVDDMIIEAPKVDSLGLSIVIYWPSYP